MTCSYCRSWNAEGDHRCRRCGRRLSGSHPIPSQNDGSEFPHATFTDGALAAAPAMAARVGGQPQNHVQGQATLFVDRSAPKVVPIKPAGLAYFEAAPSSRLDPARVEAPVVERAAPVKRARKTVEEQTSLDFLPAAPTAPRTLKTSVEAAIYCDAPVAAPMHRAVAAVLNASLVTIGYGLFLLAFYFGGGELALNQTNLLVFGAAYVLLHMFYGFIWALAGRDTPGVRWTDLSLTDFDGFAPSRRQRLLRYAGSCLSVCTGGLGLFWSLADEENLTWHDHISKTFPTPRNCGRTFIRS